MAKRDDNEIMRMFTPKTANAADMAKLMALREAAIHFGKTIRKLCPDNARRMRAEEHIEVGVMLATKAITHR